jgi:hypothetical protein
MKLTAYENTRANIVHCSCSGKFFKNSEHEWVACAKGNSIVFVPHKSEQNVLDDYTLRDIQIDEISAMSSISIPGKSESAIFILGNDLTWLLIALSLSQERVNASTILTEKITIHADITAEVESILAS